LEIEENKLALCFKRSAANDIHLTTDTGLESPAFTEIRRHHFLNSLRIEYQLINTVTTQPAIPAKDRPSKIRMIPIPMSVGMRLHRG
jgi:hypothetical protein